MKCTICKQGETQPGKAIVVLERGADWSCDSLECAQERTCNPGQHRDHADLRLSAGNVGGAR